MKRHRTFLALLLSLLLLAGCAAPPTATVDTAAATEPTTFQDTLLRTEPYTEPETDKERLAYRREVVVAEMRRMMSMLWTPAQDIVYQHASYPVTLKAGRIYRGMPYAHGSGSGHGFLTYATAQDEHGVYTISGLDGRSMTGKVGTARISNDCADAVYWAWSTVSTSIRFHYTNRMTDTYGCIKVGDYVCDRASYNSSTKTVIQENGTSTMLRSYAKLQKGDALVLYTNSSGGHAVMVSEVHVERNRSGIDPYNSYVRILEQISSNLSAENTYFDEALGQEVYLACGVDTKWSFQTLLNKGYLPVTCKELIDPAPLTKESVVDSAKEYSFKTLHSGTITASYPISSLTMTITDAQGSPVQKATCYAGESNNRYSFYMSQFNSPLERLLMQGSYDPKALTPGDYHCTLTCQIATGRTFTVRDFDFTVE